MLETINIGEGSIFGVYYRSQKVFCEFCDDFVDVERIKTFFDEEGIECFTCPICSNNNPAYVVPFICKTVKEPLMDGQEIADEENVSRAWVSILLKGALSKMYVSTWRLQKELGEKSEPYDVICKMLYLLGVNVRDEKEIGKFFRLLPEEIKIKVKNGNGKNKRYRKSIMY